MSESGKNILDGVAQFRKLFAQIRALLTAADEEMVRNGWEPRGNQAVSGSSSLDRPADWLPTVVFRMYYQKNVVSFVSVILFDSDGDAKDPFTEPLVSAGYYVYGLGKRLDKALLWGWTTCHLQHTNRKDDGSLMTNTDKAWLESEKSGIIQYSSLAVPLASIRNQEHFRQGIIRPVLERVGRESSKSQRK